MTSGLLNFVSVSSSPNLKNNSRGAAKRPYD